MSFRFKPEDFHGILGPQDDNGKVVGIWIDNAVAAVANRLLDEHVKTLPEVFAPTLDGYEPLTWRPSLSSSQLPIKMRARLWGVEEIKPEKKCEHKPNPWGMSMQYDEETKTSHATCLCHGCGKRLVAKWEPVE